MNASVMAASPARRAERARAGAFSVFLAFASHLVFGSALARPSETLPRSTFMLSVEYNYSWLKYAYDNKGRRTQLIEPLYRYEPGGGLQGIIIPDALVSYQILVPQLQYGITDFLSVAVVVPIVLRTTVDPKLGWIPGDYQWPFGRAYTAQDFWEWAASMGQPRPGRWVGNEGVLSDIVLGARYRFSDHIPALARRDIGLALTVFGALPTGRKKDPEYVTSTGVTSWELHFQGELGFHLILDKRFEGLEKRLTVGLDLFYEIFFRHTYRTPRGTVNPLILTLDPYVGKSYTVNPGDFMGFAATLDVVAYFGPTHATWLSQQSIEKARNLPPMITFSFGYVFTYLYQSDWSSDSAIWDWSQEKLWRPGYKNRLLFSTVISLLRVGVPLQILLSYKNLSWIPGRNCRAADVFSVGIRGPLKFF